MPGRRRFPLAPAPNARSTGRILASTRGAVARMFRWSARGEPLSNEPFSSCRSVDIWNPQRTRRKKSLCGGQSMGKGGLVSRADAGPAPERHRRSRGLRVVSEQLRPGVYKQEHFRSCPCRLSLLNWRWGSSGRRLQLPGSWHLPLL